ncbi:hypothetical protein J3F83DRAFT_767323 [Trichoderma novae-zelandiae]
MTSPSQRSFTDDHLLFTTDYSSGFVIANTSEDHQTSKRPKTDNGDPHKPTAAGPSSATKGVKWDHIVDIYDPTHSMSRLAINSAPCLRCLFFLQEGDATRLCLNYIWKDNGAKSCLECMYDGKEANDEESQGGFTPTEAVSSQLRLARHLALQALLGAFKDPAEALEMADIDALYSVHRSHECERQAGKRKEVKPADKKGKHHGKKTNNDEAADGKSGGKSATAELPVGDKYPRGFGIQLAHVSLLRKVWKQNQTILRQLEAQGVLLSAIVRGEVPLPLNLENAEMVKSAKLACEVLEKLMKKFEVTDHGLDLPDKMRRVAMEL